MVRTMAMTITTHTCSSAHPRSSHLPVLSRHIRRNKTHPQGSTRWTQTWRWQRRPEQPRTTVGDTGPSRRSVNPWRWWCAPADPTIQTPSDCRRCAGWLRSTIGDRPGVGRRCSSGSRSRRLGGGWWWWRLGRWMWLVGCLFGEGKGVGMDAQVLGEQKAEEVD